MSLKIRYFVFACAFSVMQCFYCFPFAVVSWLLVFRLIYEGGSWVISQFNIRIYKISERFLSGSRVEAFRGNFQSFLFIIATWAVLLCLEFWWKNLKLKVRRTLTQKFEKFKLFLSNFSCFHLIAIFIFHLFRCITCKKVVTRELIKKASDIM